MRRLSKRFTGLVTLVALLISMLSIPIVAAELTDDNFLNADELEIGDISSSLQVGNFMITATPEKSVSVDANSKVAEDGTSFSQRIKLGGTGDADARSIHFSVSGNVEITVYAMSSSGSADRLVGLYSLDGTLIDEMDALGASLSMGQFSVTAGDYYLASPASGVNVYGVGISESGDEAAFETYSLNVSGMEQGDINSSMEVGNFTIAATAEKAVTIDANSKVAEDGTSFTQRLKLNGSGNADERSVHFSIPSAAKVTVYTMSGSGSAERLLGLYSLDGTTIDEMDAPSDSLNTAVFELEAGDYYLASPASGVNIYDVVVEAEGGGSEVVRLDWAEVEAPVITDVEQDGGTVKVNFTLVTGNDGADKAVVSAMDADGEVVDTVLVGRGASTERVASFAFESSGTYTFIVEAMRNDEDTTKESNTFEKEFVLPLKQPIVNAYNLTGGKLRVEWNEIDEVESYLVEYKLTGEGTYEQIAVGSNTEIVIEGLEEGNTYEIIIKAVRGSEEVASDAIEKLYKDEDQRAWAFTYFGQSVSSSRNTFEMVDEDNFIFKLNSCTIKDDGSIDGKGGKFTAYHDGISYYYTKVDPETENFELTATFTLDYINPTPDGQEGFGLLVMDSLGEYGVSSVNHYTNSAGIIATKFEETIDGVKYTSRDTLGSRFVTGITPEVLAIGDSGIAEYGRSVSKGYSYAEEDLVKTGEEYTLTLKKTNTGYHVSMDGVEERILYGVDKLLQLDEENIYVGFAVARGCNVTVSDVSFTTSDPATDPPAEEEPPELISYSNKINSPSTTANENYEFVYTPSVPGTLTVSNSSGKTIIDEVYVEVKEDFTQVIKLDEGENELTIEFTPDSDYIPGDNQLLASYDTITKVFNVTYKSYSGSTLYVTPDGTADGDGSKEAPLDVITATQFLGDSQTIELAGGTYYMTEGLIIERGNSGTNSFRKIMKSAYGERAVLDFSNADAGMQIWGDFWWVEDIDIAETIGNVKGLQVAGSYNYIRGVNAYNNGDTGIQISGTSQETFEKWPAYNQIINCTSYDNCDPAFNNADGFAAKLTCGDGNVFRGCIAYNNIDDGWDLFAKIETGPIGAVIIEDCVTYNNGWLSDGTGYGDGNGFKLGGDGIAVYHKLINSVSYNNYADGITSNSNPAAIVESSTSYGNEGRNITLYGKGSDDRMFIVQNALSVDGGSADNVSEMPALITNNNYFWYGSHAMNKDGDKVDASIFKSVDMTIVPEIDGNGSVIMNGLLELNDDATISSGAKLK